MDKVWRFLRTVAWSSVGVVFAGAVIGVLNAVQDGDFLQAKIAATLGILTVIGSGIVAVVQAALTRTQQNTSVLYRTVSQFLQVLVAGVAAPVAYDTFTDTTVSYAGSWGSLVITALIAALTSYSVNSREASVSAVTPAPTK